MNDGIFNELDFDPKYLYTFSYSKFLDEMLACNCNNLEEIIWAEDIPNGEVVLNGRVKDTKGNTYIISPRWCDLWILKENVDNYNVKVEIERQDEGNLYQARINELEFEIKKLKQRLNKKGDE